MENTTSTVKDAVLTAMLNDLLALDHDALQAYDVAIGALLDPTYVEQVRAFRADHERHIQELVPLIREKGGIPIEMPHMPTGLFKLAVQKAGAAAGGDRAVLLAFKANERQGRDDYRRAADKMVPQGEERLGDILRRAAADESRHYQWVLETHEELGAGEQTTIGKVERAFEIAHTKNADTVEFAGKGVIAAGDSVRRLATRQPLGAALVALGVGIVLGAMGGGSSSASGGAVRRF